MNFLRFLRSAAAAAAFATGLAAAPPLTTVQDVLYKADGTRFNGTAVVTWRSFEATDQSAITMHHLTVKIVDGQLRVQLVPNAGVTPAAYYSVKYSSDGKVQFEESWMVPVSARPVRVRDVRLASPAAVEAPSQITEADVVGLVADLNARPTRGPGYAPGRAAVISAIGALEAAVGNPADCVRVDGSAGPCGTGGGGEPGFVDNESPAGAVDGANSTFTLSATPVPAASLALYRNGMLMKSGQDYTLAERTISFIAEAAPQPGDTLLASYRRQSSSGGLSSPQVVCSGTGSTTSALASASLGTCAIAAGALAAGDRLEIQFDYAHAGSAGEFRLEAAWGDTVMVSRSAPAPETLVSGRSYAAVSDDAIQISLQTWGAQLGLGTGVMSTAIGLDAPVVIDFRGHVTAPGDSLKLANYTVVRYPAP